MAILIPSKNIYKIETSKLNNNAYNKITVGRKNITPENNYDTTVYNETFSGYEPKRVSTKNEKYKYQVEAYIIDAGILNFYVGAFAGFRTHKVAELEIYIPIVENNKYIPLKSIFNDIADGGYAKLNYTTYGYTETGEASSQKYQFDKDEPLIQLYTADTKSENGIIDIPKTLSKSVELNYSGVVKLSQKAEIELADVTNEKEFVYVQIKEKDGIDYYYFKLRLLVGVTAITLSAKEAPALNYPLRDDFPLNGEYTRYVVEEIQLSIKGNTLSISVEDGSVTVGSGKNIFSIEGNELLQDSATYNTKPLSEHIGNAILKNYAKGKETATVLCDINDYYEYDATAEKFKGDKIISIDSNQLTIPINSTVVPMSFGADGIDRPISYKKDGNAKEFIVVGSKIIYDGAVWQELYLQEKL